MASGYVLGAVVHVPRNVYTACRECCVVLRGTSRTMPEAAGALYRGRWEPGQGTPPDVLDRFPPRPRRDLPRACRMCGGGRLSPKHFFEGNCGAARDAERRGVPRQPAPDSLRPRPAAAATIFLCWPCMRFWRHDLYKLQGTLI